MALTDIVAPPGNTAAIYFNRGDIGVLVDIVAKDENVFAIPEVEQVGGGGNIFIMSE